MAETKRYSLALSGRTGRRRAGSEFFKPHGLLLLSDLVALVNVVACLQHRNVFSMAGPVAGLSPQNA